MSLPQKSLVRSAIPQNIGTTITALVPAHFAAMAPPGVVNIPPTIGAITFGVTVIAAGLAAFTARETCRVHLNDLGKSGFESIKITVQCH